MEAKNSEVDHLQTRKSHIEYRSQVLDNEAYHLRKSLREVQKLLSDRTEETQQARGETFCKYLDIKKR